MGVVECEDIWDPIDNYYCRSTPVTPDHKDIPLHDGGNVTTDEGVDSDDDDDGIKDTCSNENRRRGDQR